MSLNRNRLDSYGNTLLHLLVIQDNVKSLEAVLDSLNEKIRNNPASPLSALSTFLTSSSRSASTHTIESLLNKPNHENGGKRCALHFVRSTRMLKLLLSYSNQINKDAQDMYGLTPLHMYILEGYTDCAKVIIEAGASVNINCYDNQIIEYPTTSSSNTKVASNNTGGNEEKEKGVVGDEDVIEVECGLHHRSTLLLAAQVANYEILRLLLSISKTQSLSSALHASFAWEAQKEEVRRSEKASKDKNIVLLDEENTHPNRMHTSADNVTAASTASSRVVTSTAQPSQTTHQSFRGDVPRARAGSNAMSKPLYDLTKAVMDTVDTSSPRTHSRKYSDEHGNNIWHVLFAATSLSINDGDRQRINFYPQKMLSSLSVNDKNKSNSILKGGAGLSELSDLIRLLSEQSSAANKRYSGSYTDIGNNSSDTGGDTDHTRNNDKSKGKDQHNESLFDQLLQVSPSKASDLTQQRIVRKLTAKIRKCLQLIAKRSQHRGSLSNNVYREKPLHVLVGNKVLQLQEKSRGDLDETQHWNRPVLSGSISNVNQSPASGTSSTVNMHRTASNSDSSDSYSCVLVKAFLYEIASDDNSLHKLVNILDSRGATPLFVAIEHRQFSVAEVLMRCGADLNYETKFKTSVGLAGLHHSNSSASTSRSTSTSNTNANISNMLVCPDEYVGMLPTMDSSIHVLRASDLIPKYERYRLFSAITSQQTKVPFLKNPEDGNSNSVFNGCMECGDMLTIEDSKSASASTSTASSRATSRHNSNDHGNATTCTNHGSDSEHIHCSHCQRLLCQHCGGYRVPLPRVFETIPPESRTMPSFLAPELYIDFCVDEDVEVVQTSNFIVRNTVGSCCYFNLCVICCDIYRERCIDVHKIDKGGNAKEKDEDKTGRGVSEAMVRGYGKGSKSMPTMSPPKRKLPSPIKAMRKQYRLPLLEVEIEEGGEEEDDGDEDDQDDDDGDMAMSDDRSVRRLDFSLDNWEESPKVSTPARGMVLPTPDRAAERLGAGWVMMSLLVVFVAMLVVALHTFNGNT